METIHLHHGSGGKLTRDLIRDLFVAQLSNGNAYCYGDSAIIDMPAGKIAYTTDAFVISPLFFPGGSIGKLAICGTVNDLAVSDALPVLLTASFIIEEGFPLNDLKNIVADMAETARLADVKIVAGDTKVVQKGQCDGLYISMSGIGIAPQDAEDKALGLWLEPGNKIILTGTIGDHGMAILNAREALGLQSELLSDCACLHKMLGGLRHWDFGVHFMRDATRGGVAMVLSELVEGKPYGIKIYEKDIPVRAEVNSMCDLLGFDPLYLANEGKAVLVVRQESAEAVVNYLREDELGKNACIIGEIQEEFPGMVVMDTLIGGHRVVDMPVGDQLPRIC
ncbi:MAG: hydrogenase expression/formation protein HypE [Cyclobacteriaceae bacterium]|nr:hydrogenase expression/formation protein HypE [Cyclobacteriaceae bacterium]